MDPATILWLEAKDEDNYWETSYRRSYPEGNQFRGIFDVPADTDDQEDAGNDTRRRERVDEAMYEC